MACAVLHNLCIDARVPLPVVLEDNDYDDRNEDVGYGGLVNRNAADGVALRERIVQGFN